MKPKKIWRLLEKGEKLQKGDQVWLTGWFIADEKSQIRGFLYRRRLTLSCLSEGVKSATNIVANHQTNGHKQERHPQRASTINTRKQG